jgi:serine phosphatase RsbU (regulator of sigma subunit)
LLPGDTGVLVKTKLNDLAANPNQSVWLESEEKLSDKNSFVHWEMNYLESDQINASLIFMVGRDVTALRTAHAKIFELQKNIELSRIVQTLLLPKDRQYRDKSLEVETFYKPADATGGDWCWYKKLADDSMLLLIGDVTGHGLGPAMITAAIAGINEVAFNRFDPTKETIADKLNLIDLAMSSLCNQLYLMSLVTIVIHPDSNKIRVWNNGGPHPIIIRANKTFETLRTSGTLIGSSKTTFTEETVDFNAGDMLFVYTDGLYEVTYQGRTLNAKKIAQLLEASLMETVTATIAGFTATAMSTTTGRVDFPDDITMLGIRKISL